MLVVGGPKTESILVKSNLQRSPTALGLIILLVTSCSPSNNSERPKNVILLSIDTLSGPVLRTFSREAPALPNLDRFSMRAVRFKNAYTPGSWTLPAHASLMTGLYPDRHGATDPRLKLSSNVPTLAALLKTAGFETVGFTDESFVGHQYGFNNGFDRYDGWVRSDDWRPELKLPRDGGRHHIASAHLFDRAITFLSDHRPDDPPLFLFLHTYSVHDYFKTYGRIDDQHPNKTEVKENFRHCLTKLERCTAKEWEQLQDLYQAKLFELDEGFGRLLTAVEENGLQNSTLLFVVSDHGEGFDYARRRIHHAGRLHEDLVRIPVLAAGPGLTPRIAGEPISLVDVMPSILEIFDVSWSGALDGISFANSLYPKTSRESSPDRVIYTMEHAYQWVDGVRDEVNATRSTPLSIAVIRGNLWFIRGQSREELYDMEFDPEQRENLAPASQHLPTLRDLADERLAFHPPEEIMEMDEELLERLRSLGYLR